MKYTSVILLGFCLFSPASRADTLCEVDHLLGYIEKSQCTFIRNGESHDSLDARTHIERKYDHIKRRIETTGQFIEYAATKSSTSGEPYRVICAGQEELSASWLKRELARLRAKSVCASN